MANTFNFGNGKWATKKDRILGFNNQNANFKPLAFSNTRASIATVVNKTGLVETIVNGMPRVDYLSSTNGGYLVEPQSTNVFNYSEAFSNSYWVKSGTSVEDGFSAPSVDSPLGASKLVESTANSNHFLARSAAFISGSFNTASFFVKANGRSSISIRSGNSAVWSASALFNISTGVVTSTVNGTAKIEDYGNGYYKCSITGEAFSTASTSAVVYLDNDGLSYTGDGISGIFIFGAQLEQKASSTSYISTSGSAQTRLAETANQSFQNDVINSAEGVFYVELKALADDLTDRRIGLSNGSTGNSVRIGYGSVSNRITAVVYNGSNQAVLTHTSPDITKFSKIAVKYKVNDFALWVDGVERSTDTSGTTFSANTLSQVNFNNGGGGVANTAMFGVVKDMKIYTTILTDSQLATLTK